MIKEKNRLIIIAAAMMLIIILDNKTALSGAIQGVSLCIYTVIPSLFPLFVLSHYLTEALTGSTFGLLRSVSLACGVPKGGESLLLAGLVGGYPVGAQCIKKAYDNNLVTKQDAQRMLGFCNNAGPAFIFGMAGSMFSSGWIPLLLWIIQIISAVITGMLLPHKREHFTSLCTKKEISFVDSMQHSIRAMANVCGWVILFRIITVFLAKWFLWYFPEELQVIIYGLTELVNGCNMLNTITHEPLRFILCSALLSAGGLCVYMQTMSVVGELKTRYYVKGKLLQTLVSSILSIITVLILYPGNARNYIPLVIIIICSISIILIFKKRVDFRKRMIYNIKKSL